MNVQVLMHEVQKVTKYRKFVYGHVSQMGMVGRKRVRMVEVSSGGSGGGI